MRKISVATGLFILVVLLLPLALRLWLDARWFGAQQLEAVFLLRLRTQLALGLVAGVVATAVTALSLGWAARGVREVARKENQDTPHLTRLSAAVPPLAMVAGVVLGLAAFGQWQTLLGFQAQVPFDSRDPSFGQDIAFYVWTLPFVLAVRDWIAVTVLIVSLVTTFIYAVGFAFIRRPEPPELSAYAREFRGHPLAAPAVRHLSLLAAMLLAVLSATYWLNNWLLVFSDRGVVYGATATDVHAVYPANVIMACLAGGMAVLLVALAIRARAQALGSLVAIALVLPIAWLVLALVLGGLWPGLYERFAVHPQQLAAETPYIRNNIVSTRQAMDLARIDVRELVDAGNLDSSILADNQSALGDVRITDWRPLQSAYNQLQRIRQYYEFADVDVDRYDLQAGRRQVMLSTRELDTNSLAQVARTWQNTHLVYTHGQGVVVSPVSQVDEQGLPILLERNIPATTEEPTLQLDRPQVYFGLLPAPYAIVGTRLNEFDRPGEAEATEITSRYAGSGGVAIGGGVERLAIAAALADINVLLSSDIGPDSQVLLYRQVQDRVEHTAPFLRLDGDPYQVILNGHLLWIQDAYTWTDAYPDATQQSGANYLRNSVKVTVDDYDGSMHFYILQPDEPILRVWMHLYPTLFTPLEDAPAGLAAHFRYPEDLFNAQANLLSTYHMTDPQTFYNREDLWNVAQETYGNRVQPMQAYFTTLRLPGETGTEFATILPFTPSGENRTNMLAWMVARSDAPHYGELRLYRFPQGKLIYGPQQIEARINQEPSISSEITLWSQQGSAVLRGNLLVIPLEDAVLYVQPLYIQAQSNPLPELKRVIVASTTSIVMSDRLETALAALGQGRTGEVLFVRPAQPAAAGAQATGPTTAAQLAATARQHLQAAEAAAGRGDWTTYGAEMAALRQLLDQATGSGAE